MTTPNAPSGPPASAPAEDLPVDAARALVLQWAAPVSGSETVALDDALGRVLAADLLAPFDVPAHDHAAMDGYAFDGALLADPAATLRLTVAGKALAGHPFDGVAPAGGCIRIMTGAPMPAGCDTVVPQERVTRAGDAVSFAAAGLARGANRRVAGEDLAAGRPALQAGRVLRAADIGLAASLGHAALTVRRRPRVAFFSTGDELRAPGEPLGASGIYDSNRPTLRAMLQRIGCEPLDYGIVRDDPAALADAFARASQHADAVLTSGGVSVGEADFTRAQLQTLGETAFWHLALRPGRPLAFGRLKSAQADGEPARPLLFFGLPGNPVATMVTFSQIVRPALLALAGATPEPAPLIRAVCSVPLRKRAGRTEFQRGCATRAPDGIWHVSPTGSQSSAALSTMSAANCFIVLAHEQTNVDAGAAVDILLLDLAF